MTATAPVADFFAALRWCAEVDRYFRLKEGTARKAVESGKIKATRRDRCGKTGYLVDPKDAAAMWGPQ